MSWWCYLQPDHRFADADGNQPLSRPSTLPLPQPTLASNLEWDRLNRAGPLGFSTILIALTWWAAVDPRGTSLETLKLLTTDVAYAIKGILLTYTTDPLGEPFSP